MKPFKFGLACLACILGLSISAPSGAQTLELEPIGAGYLTLPVMIDGQGPYRFVFDTGASHTAIAEPVATALGFVSVWSDYDDIQSLTRVFTAERFELSRMQIGDLDPIDINAVVVPVAPENPLVIAGLIGSDAIGPQGYQIDFARGVLDLDLHEARFADGLYDPERRLLYGAARIAGQREPVRVFIDSGSPYTIVNQAFRESPRRGAGVNMRYGIFGVDDEEEEDGVDARPLRRVQFGGVCWGVATAIKAELDIFTALGWEDVPAMVMGMDMLSAGILTVDRETGFFDFEPATPEAACDHDRRIRYTDLRLRDPA